MRKSGLLLDSSNLILDVRSHEVRNEGGVRDSVNWYCCWNQQSTGDVCMFVPANPRVLGEVCECGVRLATVFRVLRALCFEPHRHAL